MHSVDHRHRDVGVKTPYASGYRPLHRQAAQRWKVDGYAKSLNRQSADYAGAGAEPIGIRALRTWERAQKGLDPTSAAILSYLIAVSTQGKCKVFQKTIATKTGVGIATVRRRLPLLGHLGLISRVPQYGTKGRAADEFRLNLGCTVRLDQAQRGDLIRHFNRRDAGPATPSPSTPKPDAVSTTVVLTVSEHSPTGSVLSRLGFFASSEPKSLRWPERVSFGRYAADRRCRRSGFLRC